MRAFFNIDRFLKVTRILPMSVTKVPSKVEINRNWRRQILQGQQFSALVSPWLTNQSLKHSTFQPLSCSFLHKLSPIPPFSHPTFSSTRMRNPLVIIFFPLFQPFRFLSFFFFWQFECQNSFSRISPELSKFERSFSRTLRGSTRLRELSDFEINWRGNTNWERLSSQAC